MGVFDYVKCDYPLPEGLSSDGYFQTKCTPAQALDLYEIRSDGTLWQEDYDVEDRSDPNAKGIAALVGCMTRVNKRWSPVAYTGEIRFYDFHDERDWIEFSSYFIEGRLQSVTLLSDRPALKAEGQGDG